MAQLEVALTWPAIMWKLLSTISATVPATPALKRTRTGCLKLTLNLKLMILPSWAKAEVLGFGGTAFV